MLTPGIRTSRNDVERARKERRLRSPHLAEIDGRVPGLPALQEALNRWMQRNGVELLEPKRAMSAYGSVLRAHVLERPGHVGGEDHVDHVLSPRDSVRERSSRRARPDLRAAPRCRAGRALFPPRAHAAAHGAGSRRSALPHREAARPHRLGFTCRRSRMRPRQRRIAETRTRGSPTQPAEEPKPREPRSLVASSPTSIEPNRSDRSDDELGDPHSDLDGERLSRVRVQEHDRDLSPVARIDQARGVDDPEPVARSEPGPRLHEPRIPVGNLHGDTGWHDGALAWVELELPHTPRGRSRRLRRTLASAAARPHAGGERRRRSPRRNLRVGIELCLPRDEEPGKPRYLSTRQPRTNAHPFGRVPPLGDRRSQPVQPRE